MKYRLLSSLLSSNNLLAWAVGLAGVLACPCPRLARFASAELSGRVVHGSALAVLAAPPPVLAQLRGSGRDGGGRSQAAGESRIRARASNHGRQRQLLQLRHPGLGELSKTGVGLQLCGGELVLDVRVVRRRHLHKIYEYLL